MSQILHSIHASLHQYAYLPVILFVVALLIIVASIYNHNDRLRYTGYVVGVALLLSCVFIF
jgi:hypothetical protein